MTNKYILGVDTGGTFTDFVLWHDRTVRIHKCLSTPAAPEQAILQGINELGLDKLDEGSELFVIHGSTVATNAILEGKGVKTAFITNQGFADMLTIGRQTRRELYNLQPENLAPPVATEYCLETTGRIDAKGDVISHLTRDDIDNLLQRLEQLVPRAVAINFLFSYVNPKFEREIEQAIAERFGDGMFISRSSAILPEYKEYERGMTTWLNAYVGPLVENYLQHLCSEIQHAHVSVMQSSGGTIDARLAGQQAVHMVLSGPAGGLAAAYHLGELTQQPRLLTFDMGGTSTDVALIDGELVLTNEGHIGRYPVAIPMVDMHTIGAGGGSIASVDEGGLLKVGPESAGAVPGPACYGQDGQQATVTDANLVLGRLQADAFLGGSMQLNVNAARQAVQAVADRLQLSLEQTATGIIDLANEHMSQALRVMSIQRGVDPRELSLMSFGGAGGLHVCALAEALGMKNAIVPINSGVLSALGMLVAPRSRQLSQTLTKPLDQCSATDIEQGFAPLVEQGRAALHAEGVNDEAINIEYSLDLRYLGQAYYLNVAWPRTGNALAQVRTAFHDLHQQRYGHALDMDLELVNIRVALYSASEQPSLVYGPDDSQTPTRTVELVGIDEPVNLVEHSSMSPGHVLSGPALVTETVATTFIAKGWQARVDQYGNILLTHTASGGTE